MTLTELQRIMREVFVNPGLVLSADMSALDIDGWDSLSHTVLMVEIEQAAGVRVDLRHVSTLNDLGQLLAYVNALPRLALGA
jgi:acyl carrier protein